MADDSDDESFRDREVLNNVNENVNRLPDGGYVWVVTFAAFMCHFVADGMAFTFGVIYSDLLDAFGASKSATSWVASIFVGMALLCGPIAGWFVNRFGCRCSAIFGGIITSLGVLLSAFATSIEMLCFTYGVVSGFGLAFVYVPASVIPSFWFEKKRALATGMAASGSGLGTFAVAPLIEYLLGEYGWRGTLLCLSGVTLNIIVFGALFRDLPSQVIPADTEKLGSLQMDHAKSIGKLSSLVSHQSFRSLNTDLKSLESRSNYAHSPLRLSPRHETPASDVEDRLTHTHSQHLDIEAAEESRAKAHQSTGNINYLFVSNRSLFPVSRHDFTSVLNLAARQRTISSCPELSTLSAELEETISKTPRLIRIAKNFTKLAMEMCDVRLMAVPVYAIFFVSNFTLSYAYDLPYIYLPDYASDKGIANASFLISIIGIVNTFGQIIYGYLGDKKAINTLVLFGASIFVCGCLVSILPLLHTYVSLAVCSALFGLFISASFALETVVLVKILSLDQLTKAYGFLMFGQGVASLIGPPIGGLLWDLTKTYTYTFVFTGVSIALSGFLTLIIVPIKNKSRSRSISESTDLTTPRM